MAIYIAGRDYLVRQGIKAIVENIGHESMEISSGSSTPEEAELFIGIFENGTDPLLGRISGIVTSTPVLMVADDFGREDIVRLTELGVRNIVTKKCSEDEIENAINSALAGKRFFCSKVLELLMGPVTTVDRFSQLSGREKQVLSLILEGKTSGQISQELFISLHTVNSHRKNILKKTGLKSPAELILYAADHGIKPHML